MLKIESMSASAIPEVAPLVAQFRVTLQSYKGIKAQPNEEEGAEELKEYLDSGFPVFTARQDGACCGYMVLRTEGPCVWVESLYVRPDCRRQGIAAALFEQAEEFAAARGEDTLYNYVHPNNDGVIQFLRSRGYSVLNLIEIRKPYADEKLSQKISVGGNEFDY